MSTCFICGQIAGDPAADLLADTLGGTYRRRVLVESRSFAAIPSLGGLIAGHVILCPVEHLRRMADASDACSREYAEVQRALVALLAKEFGGEVHLFEHGCSRDGRTVPCTVDHAHVHYLPLPPGISPQLPRAYTWHAIPNGLRSLRDSAPDSEYLYYEAPDGAAWLALPGDAPFQSQILRRAFADALGIGESWNWRADSRRAVVVETESRVDSAWAMTRDRSGLES